MNKNDLLLYSEKFDTDLLKAYRSYLLIVSDNNSKAEKKALIEKCKEAANEGDPLFSCVLGYLYYFEDANSSIGNAFDANKWFKQAAADNFLEAKYALGCTLLDKSNLLEDKDEGLRLLEELVDANFIKAIYKLGVLYEEGNIVEKDYTKARKYFEIAIQNGYIKAYKHVGNMYNDGLGVEQDRNKSFQYYKNGAMGGDELAQCNYGNCFNFGWGVEVDHKKANMWYKQAIEQGSYVAINNLADNYRYGRGVEKNLDTAIEMYKEVRERNENFAIRSIADIYYWDKKDYDKAFEYYSKLENSTLSDAILQLGYMYDVGLSVESNKEKAFELYKKSADLGNGISITNIGNFYRDGVVVQQDLKKAFEMYNEAYNKGNKNAASSIAWCLEFGKGTDSDIKRAVEFYKIAADNGETYGQFRYGYMRYYYSSVQDYNEALKYLLLAAQKNHAQAYYYLAKLYNIGYKDSNLSMNYLDLLFKSAELGYKYAYIAIGDSYQSSSTIDKAIKYYELAGEAGCSEAWLELGNLYDYGIYIHKDYYRAAQYYKKGAAAGESSCQYKLSTFHYRKFR